VGTWLEKQRNLMDFALSSLVRRKLKNLGLLALYTLIVFLLASVMFFTHALRREALLVLEGAPEITVQRVVAGRHDLMPTPYVAMIEDIRGVASVQTRLWGYYYDGVVGANYTLLVPPGTSPTARRDDPHGPGETPAVEGEAGPPTSPVGSLVGSLVADLDLGALAPGTIVIGAGVARMQHRQTGDTMAFRASDGSLLPLRVGAVFSSASELVSSDLIVLTEPDFRRLFGIARDYVTDVTVSVRNPREVAMVAGKISRQLPDTRPIVRDEILRTYDSVFNWRSGILVVILSAAVLAFVIFAWDKASGLSAAERREIGILKAIGWETGEVIQMKFWEGATVSLAAFFAGVILAYVHVFFTSAAVFAPVLRGWSVLYPAFDLTPFVSVEQLITLFFLTVVPYAVATMVPAWRAATIDPDAAMRQAE